MTISYQDVVTAASRISGMAIRTPLLHHPMLDESTGGRVFIKPENLQRTGSFKFRGAYNRLSAMTNAEKARGVLAISSGNHAQGVALAARLLGIKATILMPSDAPSLKIARTRRDGADVVLFDRATTDRNELANSIARESGAVLVLPFDDPFIMAGQGTAGLEAAEDLEALGISLNHAFVCCSGGGLASGVGVALREFFPLCGVHPVEPEGFDDMMRSLSAGERMKNAAKSGSVQDALLVDMPGILTFPVLSALGATGFAVSDEAALKAVGFAYRELKLVLEPGGAAALAHVLDAGKTYKGQTLLIIASGGNIDDVMMARAFALTPQA